MVGGGKIFFGFKSKFRTRTHTSNIFITVVQFIIYYGLTNYVRDSLARTQKTIQYTRHNNYCMAHTHTYVPTTRIYEFSLLIFENKLARVIADEFADDSCHLKFHCGCILSYALIDRRSNANSSIMYIWCSRPGGRSEN